MTCSTTNTVPEALRDPGSARTRTGSGRTLRRWSLPAFLLVVGCGGGIPEPEGMVTLDGQAFAPTECWAGPCGADTPECSQPEGVDGGAAMSFDVGSQRIIVYPLSEGRGDVFWDGGCTESMTSEGPLGTTETCIEWDHVLFTGCWTGDYASEQDGPGSSYRLVDAMIDCSLEGRTLSGSLRCERGTGDLAKDNGL